MPTTAAAAEPRKRPRQGRSRATVERILDAAARIFDERGYRVTTTNHVAEAAGVSVGSLYQYFPHKDALLVGLAERHVAGAADAFVERLAELRAEAPALPAVVTSLVALAVDLNGGSRLHALLFRERPRTEALQAQLDALIDGIVEDVAWHLVRTGAGGADPRRRARLLAAAVDAAVHEVIVPERDEGRRAAVDDLVEVLVDGLAGRGRSGP